MPRTKKKKKENPEATWLITFSDMMTLLLTFFVLLNSMSVIDERRKLVTLGSIIGTFGPGKQSYEVLTTKETKRTLEPGPFEDLENMELVKPAIWDEFSKDLNFLENKFVQILSISTDVLFPPGGVELTPEGRRILSTVSDILGNVRFPILVAGHTSIMRDEEGVDYKIEEMFTRFDPSWQLSLQRTLAVYRFILDQDVPPRQLRVESFGKYRPRRTNDTMAGRAQNRRVDIILDKRNQGVDEAVAEALGEEAPAQEGYQWQGFEFDTEQAPPPPGLVE